MVRFLCVMIFLLGCGQNVYKPLTKNTSDAYYLEEARIRLDEDDYTAANDALSKVKRQDNDWVILKVSSLIGEVGLGLWDLILKLIDTKNLSSQSGNGADRLINAMDSAFFGEGTERTKKETALTNSIDLLRKAEQTSAVENLRCLFGSFLILPVVASSKDIISSVETALSTIAAGVVGGGATSAECPGVDDLNSAFQSATSALSKLSTAKDEYGSCKIFQAATSSASSLNQIQDKIDNLLKKADKGCVNVCGLSSALCEAIKFPCVSTLLEINDAVAGDGVVTLCELIQNCGTSAGCFL